MRLQELSARAYDRRLKVSRTITDLEGCEAIGQGEITSQLPSHSATGGFRIRILSQSQKRTDKVMNDRKT